jgi:hypothetical protein
MKGIQYLVDSKGVPKAVVIDLRKHRRLWEDFQDLLVARERRDEPRERFETVKANLQKHRLVKK